MFNSVLIAEDHQSTKISVEQTLKELGIINSQYVYYCDDAILRLRHSLTEKRPFELLITDLSFADDGREQKISNGSALIEAARTLQPELKILVFSIETNPAVVSSLFNKLEINGYVRKGRRDAIELKEAIDMIYRGKKYIPTEFIQSVRQQNAYDFTEYDIMIVSQLAKGTFQKEIPAYLQQQKVRASSLSSVEKRLNQIKEALGFTKNEQLIAYCKDYHII
jgi:two-component system capsular synthesis response regulator RcsB